MGDTLSGSLIIAWARAQQVYSVSWRMGPFSWAERASGKGGLLGSERLGLTLITFGTKGKLPNLSALLRYKIKKEGREEGKMKWEKKVARWTADTVQARMSILGVREMVALCRPGMRVGTFL